MIEDKKGNPAGAVEPWQEPETTIVRGIANGGMGGEPSAVDSKNGKIVRIRPIRWDWKYTREELKDKLWKFESRGKSFECPIKSQPPYFALSYKKRVYSPNRVKYPLKTRGLGTRRRPEQNQRAQPRQKQVQTDFMGRSHLDHRQRDPPCAK